MLIIISAFSKFILGSEAHHHSASRTNFTTAFKNPDGKIAVIVMNQGDIRRIPYMLWVKAVLFSLQHTLIP